ncbi:MAG: rhomboid family intramembrane serine protease [Nitriliruptor sp.]|uniref:rhomboid family intramembrane serine protease n=1 Tax=Nitriliruptor sp. TaxID=2448056 RepID=UPI00349FF282
MVLPVGDLNPTSRRAVVTFVLLATNVAVYLGFQAPSEGCAAAGFLYRFSAIPREVLTLEPLPPGELEALLGSCAATVSGKSVLVSLVTATFLHGNLTHLLGNMLFLWVFGNNVEDRLGRIRYLVFYLVGGAVATLAFVALNPGGTTPLVGASGAIAAILGAYLLLHPRAKVLTYVPFPLYLLAFVVPGARIRAWFLIFAIVTLPAWLVLGGWFVLQATAARTMLAGGVAYEAHVAGFLAGIVLLLLLDRRRAAHGQVPFHPPRRR